MLTKITITVPDLGDNRKNLEVEGALAVGEKATVTLVGIPAGTTTDGKQLRLRVLGPMGEDLAAHGDWTVGTDGEYVTDIDLASVQAYRLFVPPPPPPPPPRMRPIGYPPVRPAVVPGMKVRLLVELREYGSDSDGDMSMLGIAERPLVYWPTDWKTATLIDLANGHVYSKEEVDALFAQEAQERASGDEAATRIATQAFEKAEAALRGVDVQEAWNIRQDGRLNAIESKEAGWDAKYDKPSGGIPKSDMASSVQASLGKADTALQVHQDISGKADLVDGKVPSSQLPSYVDDVLEYASLSAFPATGEEGKIYVALDTNKTYRWSGTTYVQIGGGEIPVPVAPSTDPSAAGKPADAKATGDALAGKASTSDTTLTALSSEWVVGSVVLAAAQTYASSIGRSDLATGSTLEFRSFANPGPTTHSVWLVGENDNTGIEIGEGNLGSDGTEFLWWIGFIEVERGTVVATRQSTVPAYKLGSQTDKPLAPAGDYALKSDIPAHVQADWDESDSDEDDFIRNKPEIPSTPADIGAAPAQHTHAQTDVTGLADALADKASTADATLTSVLNDWVFADGLLAAMQAAFVERPDLAANSHLEIAMTAYGTEAWIVADGYTGGDDAHGVAFAEVAPSADGLSELMVDGMPQALAVVPAGSAVATRSTVSGYQLGSQTDKPLAPAGDYALKSEIPAVPVKAVKRNGTALTPDANGAVNVEVPTGTAATKDVPASGNASSTQVVMGDDSRLTNARTPTGHKSTHSTGGADALTPADIGAQAALTFDNVPTANSDNPVKSGGVKTALAAKQDNMVVLTYGTSTWAEFTAAHAKNAVIFCRKQTQTNVYRMAFLAFVSGNDAEFQYYRSVGTHDDTNQCDQVFIYKLTSGGTWSETTREAALKITTGTGIAKTVTTSAGAGTIKLALNPAPTASDNGKVLGVTDSSGTLGWVEQSGGGNANLLAYTTGTTLDPDTAVYKGNLASDGTFPTITATGIQTAAAYYQFELELSVPSTVPSTITGPSGWTFLDGHGLPDPADLTGGETIYISCRMDCGATGKPVLASVWRVS